MSAVCRGMGRQKSIPPSSSKKNGDITRLLLDKKRCKGRRNIRKGRLCESRYRWKIPWITNLK